MKKNIGLSFAFLSIALLASCGTNSNQVSIIDKEVKLYTVNVKNSTSFPLHFIGGANDIPFVDVKTAFAQYEEIMTSIMAGDYQGSLQNEGEAYSFVRDNGSSLSIDFKAKTLTYYHLEELYRNGSAETGNDILTCKTSNSAGEPSFFERVPSSSSFRAGQATITVDLGAKNIPLYYQNGVGYLPLATFSDFFFSPLGLFYVYNGANVFLMNEDFADADTQKEYYSTPQGERSSALADFTYHEFTAMLDTFYGLKKEKDITSFDDFFTNTGLKENLLSKDGLVADKALASLAWSYLGDGHTKYLRNSPYAGNAVTLTVADYGNEEYLDLFDRITSVKAKRATVYPNGVPAYEVVGNTAFLTFDNFISTTEDARYYGAGPQENETDTIGRIAYAQKQILANPLIKNVVMDLSCNTGGDANAAIYATAWFLGTTHISLTNTVSGSLAMNAYRADTNLDRKFDDEDTPAGKRLFCLTSRASFSCGNLVPCTFKGSGKVSLVGENSGGGSCVVTMMALADGTIYRISGCRHLQKIYNGTAYDIDRGAAPDYPIGDLNFLFENKRLNLVTYLNTLH